MSSLVPPEGRWFRKFGTSTSARLRLVCFPHAGGAASFFRDWSQRLPSDVELWAIQYPGRENRIREPLIPDMHSLAELIASELRRLLDLPTVIFGHSMGAAVGYEVVRRLTDTGGHTPRHLVVSGCAAPHRIRPFVGHEGVHLLDDDQLVTMLKRLDAGGTELLDDPDMRQVFLPTIRNDYELIQSYTGSLNPVLETDVTAFTGRHDDAIQADDLRAWGEVSRGRFGIRSFPGGHFYLAHYQDETVRAVHDVLDAVL